MTTGLYSQHLNDRKKLYIRNIVLALLLILFAALALFPIFYMIMSSFGPAVATAGTSRSVIPKRLTLDSYKAFFSFNRYSVRWIWNSFVVASLTVIGNVIFASLAGYAFSKINFKGRRWMFGMILVAMMIPYQVTQVPLYILIANKLKMTNTFFPASLHRTTFFWQSSSSQVSLHRSLRARSSTGAANCAYL